MSEKRKDFTVAMEGYVMCLNQCAAITNQANTVLATERTASTTSSNRYEQQGNGTTDQYSSNESIDTNSSIETNNAAQKVVFMKELRGEVMLRIAVLKKEMGALDQAMQMCNTITAEPFGDCIRANALCLKVFDTLLICTFIRI